MTGAREEILGRLRAALADRPSGPAPPRRYATVAGNGVDLVALFAERAGAYQATVERVEAAALPAAIGEVLAARGARRIVVPIGLPRAWLSSGGLAIVEDDPPLPVRDLDRFDGVVTGAALAIAETGTIVLDAGPDQGRRALSLLVDFHLCVVAASQVVGTVPEAIRRLPPTRPQTWISGPSATSDIELNRVEGVHGPRTLHILLVAGL
ncbi:MAG: lactate utilization protein C [Dactylosporangium sp.]|nr:lactate utilization protein C [Dactylosporangium sp.]NNJ59461.1 lactate utilization protein C [Dactylosporangium sp.]